MGGACVAGVGGVTAALGNGFRERLVYVVIGVVAAAIGYFHVGSLSETRGCDTGLQITIEHDRLPATLVTICMQVLHSQKDLNAELPAYLELAHSLEQQLVGVLGGGRGAGACGACARVRSVWSRRMRLVLPAVRSSAWDGSSHAFIAWQSAQGRGEHEFGSAVALSPSVSLPCGLALDYD